MTGRVFDQVEFGFAGNERHHDLRHDGHAGRAASLHRCLEDGARLHFRDLRSARSASFFGSAPMLDPPLHEFLLHSEEEIAQVVRRPPIPTC